MKEVVHAADSTDPAVAPEAAAVDPGMLEPAPEAQMMDFSVSERDLSSRLEKEDESYRNAQRASTRVMLMTIYSDLAAAMNLTDAEARQVFDILVDAQIASKFGNRSEAARERMVGLLGAARYELWREYERNAPYRDSVAKVQAMLSSTGQQALTPDQARFLVTALSAAASEGPDPALTQLASTFDSSDPASVEGFRRGQLRAASERTRRILTTAASVLTPDQLAALDDVLSEPARRDFMSMRSMEERRALRSRAEAAAGLQQ